MSISASPSRVARHLLLAVAIVAVSAVLRAEERQPFLSWEAISELPSGVAGKGVFAWEDGGSLLLAGGRLSDGRLRDAIHVLTRDAAGGLTWHSGFRLPQPLADAGVVASPRGLLVAGGVAGGDRAAGGSDAWGGSLGGGIRPKDVSAKVGNGGGCGRFRGMVAGTAASESCR